MTEMMKIFKSILLVFILLFSLNVQTSTDKLEKCENEKETKGCSSIGIIAKTPITWRDIIANIDSETHYLNPTAFGRSQESHDAYENYKVATKGQYKDSREAILTEYFEKTTGLEKRETRFKPNKFPDYVAEGIEQWVLWIFDQKFEVNSKWVQEEIEKYMSSSSSKMFVWAITPEAYRSVPDLCHVHVFVKDNNE